MHNHRVDLLRLDGRHKNFTDLRLILWASITIAPVLSVSTQICTSRIDVYEVS